MNLKCEQSKTKKDGNVEKRKKKKIPVDHGTYSAGLGSCGKYFLKNRSVRREVSFIFIDVIKIDFHIKSCFLFCLLWYDYSI